MTLVSTDHVPHAVYQEARQQFTEKKVVDLTGRLSRSMAGTGWRLRFEPCRAPFSSDEATAGDREVYTPGAVNPERMAE